MALPVPALCLATGGALVLLACAPAPPYAHLPDPTRGTTRAVIEDTTRAAGDAGLRGGPSGTRSGGACGRMLATQDHIARLRSLIAAIEADGVTDAERTDLMRAYSRLHGAEAAEIQARADVAGARYRLEALTGGDIRASDLPPCE